MTLIKDGILQPYKVLSLFYGVSLFTFYLLGCPITMIWWNQLPGGVLHCAVLITLMGFDHSNQWIRENLIFHSQNHSIFNSKFNKVFMKEKFILLLQQHIQQKNKKRGSTNLNPLGALWNRRCAILHLISTNRPHKQNKEKHWVYQTCYVLNMWWWSPWNVTLLFYFTILDSWLAKPINFGR